MQMYFIGRKGDTRLGPWVPPFSELAELYPDGEEVSLFRGYNPLSGKRVKIDYLPSVNRIRVDTFYSDRDTDRNKSIHLPLRPRTRHHLRRLVTQQRGKPRAPTPAQLLATPSSLAALPAGCDSPGVLKSAGRPPASAGGAFFLVTTTLAFPCQGRLLTRQEGGVRRPGCSEL